MNVVVRQWPWGTAATGAHRATREEVEAALRRHGADDIGDVACVMLETDGSPSTRHRAEQQAAVAFAMAKQKGARDAATVGTRAG